MDNEMLDALDALLCAAKRLSGNDPQAGCMMMLSAAACLCVEKDLFCEMVAKAWNNMHPEQMQ